MDYFDEQDDSFFKRHRTALGVAGMLVVLVVIGSVFLMRGSEEQPTKKVQQVTLVKLQPPSPPPPPPPPKEIVQQKMVEQTPVKEPEFKPEKPMDKPTPNKAPPPGPLALDQKGEGPGDGFGLGGKPGGNGLLGGGGGGSKYGYYAGIMQSQIAEVLHSNRKTRSAQGRVAFLIWIDEEGRITRLQLTGASKDAGIDEAIAREVLVGLKFREAPPKDLLAQLPIFTRISERPTSG